MAFHIFINFVLQTRDDARQFMKYLHPDLGVGNAFNFWIRLTVVDLMLDKC
jgi:hypothetical protein